MRAFVALLLLAACAPKRAPDQPATKGAPVATRLKAPDAGPFDFSARNDEKKAFVSGDMDHAGKVPGTLINIYGN